MKYGIFLVLILFSGRLFAQTDIDAIMMEKNAFCIGPMYGYSSWTNYWEGTRKRDNENLGRVSSQVYSIMGNYGISQKLNVMFNLPYVVTKASAGQLKGMRGLQDLSLIVKYRPLNKKIGYARLAAFGIAGVSAPASNYTADYLPLAIGMESRTAMLRLMLDLYYQSKWFMTASGTYTFRSNITIDRNAYYTTEMINSNKVQMPDVFSLNLRAGYRTRWLIAEAVFNQMNTLGGFDITRNNMPFPSNRMNASTLGLNFKYVLKKAPQASLTGGAHQVIAGRNMGQSLNLNLGVFYVLDLSKKTKNDKQ